MFAIVDIETCGGKYEFPKGRIIEICILVHDGIQVIEKFSSLINPDCYISPYFTNISGITNEMVEDAPRFHEVAKKIIEFTEDRVFVAHNVSFDYGFVKEEFASLGYKYRRDTLCTVRLSRQLLTKRVSYSLGRLCESLGIEIENRHRAAGDAEATAKLFDILLFEKNRQPAYKNKNLIEMNTTRLDKIKLYILKKLPEETGVYYFLDRDGNIIYIGKSNNMRQRAISHFNTKEPKNKKKLYELFNVDFELTGSELIALLHESEEIKKNLPKYNRLQKQSKFSHSIDWHYDEKGIINFRIVPQEESVDSLISFSNFISAQNCLNEWIEQYTLCLNHCDTTENEGACFNYQVKKCRGICCGEEEVESYNKRAVEIVDNYTFRETDFVIVDKGRTPEERSIVLIENGAYIGYGYIEKDQPVGDKEELKSFIKMKDSYPDTKKLIRGWMKQKNLKVVGVKTSKLAKRIPHNNFILSFSL